MSARTATRPASSRYVCLAAGARALGAPGGKRRAIAGLGELVDGAHELARNAEAVVWVHESAAESWGLPRRPGPDHALSVEQLVGRPCRDVGELGWLAVDAGPRIFLAFPGYGGGFSGLADAAELLQAVEAFRQTVGFAFMFSGPSTVHHLLRSMAKPNEPHLEPELEPAFAKSAWTVPASSWGSAGVLDTLAAAGRRWVRCFDRAGSYLSAWTGATLPDGEWSLFDAGVLDVGPESAKPAGYWLLEQLPDVGGLFDPFRRFDDAPGPAWVTTPLAQLAVELAGEPVPYRAACLSALRCRPLDATAARLRDAREQLGAIDTPPARRALRALKDAYSGGTNWFENSRRPETHPLVRPAWTRTLHDRFVANTYRSLAKATPGPWALTDIDTALFALDDVDDVPAGLRLEGLGGWKPKGAPVAIADARAAFAAGGAHAVMVLAEGRT